MQIEQLKSKDKVISQLERELGHPAVIAGPVSMATEVTRTSSSGQHSNKMETPAFSPHDVLSGLSQVFQTLHGTNRASVSTNDICFVDICDVSTSMTCCVTC